MTARPFPIRIVKGDFEYITEAFVVSATARERAVGDHQKVRVGVATVNGVDWIGAWDQAANGLLKYTPFSMFGDRSVNKQLDDGDVVVAEVTTYGTPASLEGLSVVVRGDRSSEIPSATMARDDGVFLPSAPDPHRLFASPAPIADPNTRQAIDSIVSILNTSGVTGWETALALWD